MVELIQFLLFWLIAATSAAGTLYFAITNCLRNNPDTRER